jgi:hypothetical protein
LFLLYAESDRERELLPLSNPEYREQIGLCALKRDVTEQRVWLPETHNLWGRFKDLFHLIHSGNERLGIYEYNGGLFDPERYPFLERYVIGDRYLAEALRLLTCTQAEGHCGFLDYSALDVRELGSVYEGLLEHKLILEEEELAWEKDKSQRKKTGSYYTPEYIVSYIVGETLGPLVDEIKQGLNEELDLKVLDPAMGSGHFLVSACDYLARRIAELEAELTEKETEEAVQELKRTVAVRCLHGVDLNPLATELAKLSLWLHTVAKGKPLSFLDHHLRTGNSLIGATIKDLERPPSGKAFEIGLLESKLVQDLGKAIPYLTFIKESPSDSRTDIEAKKKHWDLVNTWIGKYKQAANVWLSTCFGSKVSDGNYQQILEAVAGGKLDQVATVPFFHKAQEIATEKRFFHWELEFPDVFFDRFGRPLVNPGFDAVIGNPPWEKIAAIAPEKSFLQKAFLSIQEGEINFYGLFLFRVSQITRSLGLVGCLVPNTWLINKFDSKLRAALLLDLNFQELFYLCKRVFPDAPDTIPVMLVAAKRARADTELSSCEVKVANGVLLATPDFLTRPNWRDKACQRVWQKRPLHQISVYDTEKNAHFLNRMEEIATALGTYAHASDGIYKSTVEAVKKGTKTSNSDKPIVESADQLARYSINWKGSFIPESLWQKHVSLHHGPKIILHAARKPSLERRLVAASSNTELYFSNRFILIKQKRKGLKPYYLLALINSLALNSYFRLRFPVTDIDAYMLHQLPIRRIAFTTPKEEREQLVEEGKRLYSETLERFGSEG